MFKKEDGTFFPQELGYSQASVGDQTYFDQNKPINFLLTISTNHSLKLKKHLYTSERRINIMEL
jgi:hypothetical protein